MFSDISDKVGMKLCMFAVLMLFSSLSFGAKLDLPRGGNVNIDSSLWDAHSIDLNGEKVMTLIHKKHKDLQGFVLGGQIREEGACAKSLSHKNWVFCRKNSVEGKITNDRIHAQKKVSKKSFQNYLFSFNLPQGKEKEYSAEISALLKQLEAKP